MSDTEIGRRPFFLRTFTAVAGAFVAPAVMGTAINAVAQEHHRDKMMSHVGGDGFTLPASTKQCGACDNWGGPRRISRDRKTITFTGLGWCNNEKCPDYQTMSGPEHICPERPPCWRKWGSLG